MTSSVSRRKDQPPNPRERITTTIAATSLALAMVAGQSFAGIRHASRKAPSVVAGSVTGGANAKVTIAGTGKSSKTNASGFFILSGQSLAGRHHMTISQGKKTFSTVIQVPAGTKLTLQNTKLNSDGTAQAEQEEVEVIGTLSAVDCSASPNTVTIAPLSSGPTVLMSFDSTTTQIVDDATHSMVADCATLSATFTGATIKAEGIQAGDGSIVADKLELNHDSKAGQPGQDIHFGGIVQSESCPASIVVQRKDLTNVTVAISTATEINVDDSELQSSAICTDIPIGARVDIEGAPQADGSVNASQIEVRQNHVENQGTIDVLNCDAVPPSFSFTPDGAGSAVTVVIGPTTQIQAGDNESASCADLTTGTAKVEGVLQFDGSIAASQIEQESANDNNGEGTDDNGGDSGTDNNEHDGGGGQGTGSNQGGSGSDD